MGEIEESSLSTDDEDESRERDIMDYSLGELISRFQLLLDRAHSLLLARLGVAKRTRRTFQVEHIRDAIKFGGVDAAIRALETVQ